ncbi:MAG: DUF3987 domain-containing protein [Planctomycetes bacterium]|nr:DUF3987 domain-containing protein [Planctomycetota bacterium]
MGESAGSNVIVAHTNMDLDCFGSIVLARHLFPGYVALQSRHVHPAARTLVTMYRNHLDLLPSKEFKGQAVDHLVVLDTRSQDRVSEYFDLFEGAPSRIDVFDHHPSDSRDIPAAVFHECTLGSNTAFLGTLLMEQGIHITADDATIALAGIYADTGNFTHGNVTTEDFDVASFLLSSGASIDLVKTFLRPLREKVQIARFSEVLKDVSHRTIRGHSVLLSYTELDRPSQGLSAIVEKIFELENPQPRSCLFSDHTPEHMLQEIEFTGERASAIVNESRFLDNALGLTYQKGSGIANLIQMWDGDSIEYGRKADGLAKVYQHPVLTMCVCMTPEKFEGKYRRLASFVDEGFGQRFLYVQANVPLKGKSDAEPNPAILSHWATAIHELATMEIPQSEDEKPHPHVIRFDDEAEELLDHLSKQIADKLTGCRARLLPFWASWNTRILANIIRIAGLLHAVRHGPSFVTRDICLSDTEAAMKIMKFYCSQAETVINGTCENEIERVQEIIRKYMDGKKSGFEFSLTGFTHFVNDPRWRDVPFILETPKGKDGRGTDLDTVNLNRLRGMMHRERA